MGAKDKKQPVSDHSSDQEFDGDDEEIDIQEQVINKIKELPNLKDKVMAIAINSYLQKKRQLDAQLQKEIEQVTRKYIALMAPHIEANNKIISGTYDFTNEDFEGSNQILTGEQLASKDFYATKAPVPEYWLKAFINSDVIGEQVQEVDEPILKHLVRVEAEKSEDLSKFSVTFYFSENEWFSNQKLTKHFDIEDTQIRKAYGDQINWKPGKNVTVKVVKKKGKKGASKTKQVRQPSFFKLFREIQMNSEEQDNGAESQNQDDDVEELELQYEICEHLYEQLIPRSLEYYLEIALPDCCGEEGCEDSTCAVKSGKKAVGTGADESD